MGRQIINETNNRYGRLIVIKRAGSDKRNQALWFCKCDCGNYCIIRGRCLRSGHTKSCGCLAKEIFGSKRNQSNKGKKLPKEERELKRRIRDIKRNSKRRNLEWSLTDEEVKNLISQPCYYCGAKGRKIQ